MKSLVISPCFTRMSCSPTVKKYSYTIGENYVLVSSIHIPRIYFYVHKQKYSSACLSLKNLLGDTTRFPAKKKRKKEYSSTPRYLCPANRLARFPIQKGGNTGSKATGDFPRKENVLREDWWGGSGPSFLCGKSLERWPFKRVEFFSFFRPFSTTCCIFSTFFWSNLFVGGNYFLPQFVFFGEGEAQKAG